MSHRFDATDILVRLRRDLLEEERVLGNLRESLRVWKPEDRRGWTHYDHAHFHGISDADIRGAIYRVESRIREIRRRMEEVQRRHGRDEDEEDLVY